MTIPPGKIVILSNEHIFTYRYSERVGFLEVSHIDLKTGNTVVNEHSLSFDELVDTVRDGEYILEDTIHYPH